MTTVTGAEHTILRSLAQGKRSIVEVGVFEGATSTELCRAMSSEGRLYLVDPYRPGVRAERWLGLSFAHVVARRALAPWRDRIELVRATSLEAARHLVLPRAPELIFIDADHSFDAVRADFLAWSERLAPDGIVAFHDSRLCPVRPDLQPTTGPVHLMAEIRAGAHGPWEMVAEADSVTALRRRQPWPGGSLPAPAPG